MPTLRVILFATLLRYRPEQRHGRPFEVPFTTGASLREVLATLELPDEIVRHVFVNGEKASLDYRPNDQDEIAIFPPIAGG